MYHASKLAIHNLLSIYCVSGTVLEFFKIIYVISQHLPLQIGPYSCQSAAKMNPQCSEYFTGRFLHIISDLYTHLSTLKPEKEALKCEVEPTVKQFSLDLHWALATPKACACSQ